MVPPGTHVRDGPPNEQELKDLIEDGEIRQDLLDDVHPEDLAQAVAEVDDEVARKIVSVLPPALGAEIMARIPADPRADLLEDLDQQLAAELLANMEPDDRADALQELPPERVSVLVDALERIDPEAAQEAARLVRWEPETAGGLMTTRYMAVDVSSNVQSAMAEVRKTAAENGAESIYYIYVVSDHTLIGVASLRELILSDPYASITDVMERNVIRVAPHDDQERVARVMADYDFSVIPVVSSVGRLLGVVTIDDVVDVVIEEATEDAQKIGGVVPLEDSYFSTGLFEFVWKRGIWLVLLFLGQLLTASVMERNHNLIQQVTELIIFVPIIIAAGGNAGSQSATLIIRALAVGEVVPRDGVRVFLRELIIGVTLGVIVGAIGLARAYFSSHGVDAMDLAKVVGVSVLVVVVLSTTVGALLPIAIRRAGFDPAFSSTPFIATVVDVLGLIAYFGIAKMLLNLTF